jgi:acyl-coenzyme A synthetase/AMP-(fatty) acid ligase
MTRIPLIAHRDPQGVVAYRGAEPIVASRFLSDVARTAERLPAVRYVTNLCTDRYRFSVAFAAALCRGQVSLLPPGTAPELLERLAQDYPDTQVLTDAEIDLEGAVGDEVDADGYHAAIPIIDGAQIAAIVFTSGSTGRPVPQSKSWGSLALGAAAAARALGLEGTRRFALLGTVPAQHMYGLEATVLFALRHGFAFHAARPLYPADVSAAVAQLPVPRGLVTTPVHLRALLGAGTPLPDLRMIVCATAPLSPELAVRAEMRYATALYEVYGFTEAGMVATRRTAHQVHWHTLPGVRMREQNGQVWFGGGHVGSEVAAADVLEPVDTHTFVLRGRGADLVNVAGKRTSLATLNHELTALDGVQDGVFYMPDDAAGPVVRTTAFVVAPALSREALLAELRRRIDAAFLPRPLYFVESLPRNATGKLTRDALAALAARCAAAGARRADAAVEASVRLVPGDHAVAQGHFPGDPIIPGAMLLDEVLRAARTRQGGALSDWDIAWAKFVSPARPGEELRIRLPSRARYELAFECLVGERTVARGLLRRRGHADARPAPQ